MAGQAGQQVAAGGVAIVMPLYNAGKYFERCRRSIERQTLRSWSCWIIDDGSTDGSGEAAREWAARDSRVHLFSNPENMGCGLTRRRGINFALRHSGAAWFAFIDADDYIRDDFLETMVRACLDQEAEAAVCGTVNRDEAYAYLGQDIAETTYTVAGEQVYRDYMLSSWIKQYNGNKLFARRLIEAIEYSPLRYCEDSATTYRWLWEAAQVVVLPDAMYNYVRHADSNSNKRNEPTRKAIDTVLCVADHFRFCMEQGYTWMLERLRLFVAPHLGVALQSATEGSELEAVRGAAGLMFEGLRSNET